MKSDSGRGERFMLPGMNARVRGRMVTQRLHIAHTEQVAIFYQKSAKIFFGDFGVQGPTRRFSPSILDKINPEARRS